jgi:tRNA threonylcarbamoyladenosine biosynthesis protein TsaB
MAIILNIETTSDVCSVALSADSKLVNLKEDKGGKSHASKLTVFIDEILEEEKLSVSNLDAVSISKGPGSYTGLRIGVSTAKGLCYGSDIPLIAVPTLQSLAQGLLFKAQEAVQGGMQSSDLLVPMIDARRMEVYSAVFDWNNNSVEEASPVVLDENSYRGLLKKNRVIFFGDGMEKSKELIKHSNALFVSGIGFSAENMIPLSQYRFEHKQFEDVAYFEPFYLKDFQATKPRKNIL